MDTSLQQEGKLVDTNAFQNAHLRDFTSVNLDRMQEVNLMDRIDRKYVFPFSILPEVLSEMKSEYGTLKIDDSFYSMLESVYLDTDENKFYLQHHNGKLNRYKIRYRSYHNTKLRFLETKFKTNKGRTKKQRIPQEANDKARLGSKEKAFVSGIVPIDPDQLSRKIKVSFSRLNFLNLHKPERLTIDLNLTFSHNERSKSFPEIVIAELKQSRYDSRSVFAHIMKKHSIRVTPFSKYCIGMTYLHNVKSNRFKKILINLNKITNRK